MLVSDGDEWGQGKLTGETEKKETKNQQPMGSCPLGYSRWVDKGGSWLMRES